MTINNVNCTRAIPYNAIVRNEEKRNDVRYYLRSNLYPDQLISME